MALSRKNKTPLLPSAAQDFITARVTDAKGGLLVVSGLALSAALLTFDPKDPSFNTVAADATVHNALGSTGAYISDMLLQTLGGASYLIAPALIVWGTRILLRREISRLNLRTALLLTTTLCASITLARIPSETGYLGGSLGALLLSSLGNDLQRWLGNAAFNTVAALAFIPAATGYFFALGFSREEWKRAQDRLSFLNEYAVRLVARFIPEAAQEDAPVRRLRVSLQEDNHSEEIIEEAPKRKPVVTPTKKAPAADKQRKLNFRANDDDWELPSVDLLTDRINNNTHKMDESSLQKNALMLQSTLRDFGIEGDITKVSPGPIVTLYEMEPAPGTKTSRVIGLSDDIARSMSAVSVRVAVVPGKNAIGLELPNAKREMVFLKELISTREYEKTATKLPLVLGKDIAGAPVIADLAKMPHLLVAGTTGSGKSVAVNTMILSLLYKLSPQQCRFIMIDPKMLELSAYDDIPHLLTPVVTEPHRAITALKWAVREMEDRYRAMSKLGVRNIDGFNERIRDARSKGEVLMHKVQTGFDSDTGKPVFEEQPLPQTELPYIVIIVDEFADLMLVAGKEVENAIQRLAQMARAAGIHLIMATQRPSVDVITGIIKANFPTRISFQVTSKIDSRTILNDGGAEQLLGQGDMLYMAGGGRIQRVHGPFVADDEVEKIVKYLRSQGTPNYIEGVTVDEEEEGTFGDGDAGEGPASDALYDQAVAIIIRERKVSTSFIQRHLQIGYNRAARIVERMEREGLITPANHAGKREILGGGGNYGT